MTGFFELKQLSRSFPFFLFTMDSSMLIGHHWHKEVEIVFIKDGKLELEVNNEPVVMNAGEMCIINSGEIHSFYPSPDCIRLIIQFETTIFENTNFPNHENYDFRDLIERTPKISRMWDQVHQKKISLLIQEMEKEYMVQQDGFQFAIRARMLDFILTIIRDLPKENSGKTYLMTNKLSLQKIEKTLLYIQDNFMEPITLDEAASHVGFTSPYFAKFFKKHTGETFINYLNKFRITKAQQYLLNEDISVAEISYKAGFSSIKTFNRIFKEEIGCAPTQFKKAKSERY